MWWIMGTASGKQAISPFAIRQQELMDHLVGCRTGLFHIDGDATMAGEGGLRCALFEVLEILNAADGENVWFDRNKVPCAFS